MKCLLKLGRLGRGISQNALLSKCLFDVLEPGHLVLSILLKPFSDIILLLVVKHFVAKPFFLPPELLVKLYALFHIPVLPPGLSLLLVLLVHELGCRDFILTFKLLYLRLQLAFRKSIVLLIFSIRFQSDLARHH